MASKETVDVPIHTQDEVDGPPDGGSRAWLVVAGGFLTYFVTFGAWRYTDNMLQLMK